MDPKAREELYRRAHLHASQGRASSSSSSRGEPEQDLVVTMTKNDQQQEKEGGVPPAAAAKEEEKGKINNNNNNDTGKKRRTEQQGQVDSALADPLLDDESDCFLMDVIAKRSGDNTTIQDLQEKIAAAANYHNETPPPPSSSMGTARNTMMMETAPVGAFSCGIPGQRDTRLTRIPSKTRNWEAGTVSDDSRSIEGGGGGEEDDVTNTSSSSDLEVDLELQEGGGESTILTSTSTTLVVAAEVAPSTLELEEQLKRQITANANAAQAMVTPLDSKEHENTNTSHGGNKYKRRFLIVSAVACLLLLLLLFVTWIMAGTGKDSDTTAAAGNSSNNNLPPPPSHNNSPMTAAPTRISSSSSSKTIEEIRQRQNLRCGVSVFGAQDSGRYDGLWMDLCRAVAAAILGDPDKVEPMMVRPWTRFPLLQEGVVDLLAEPTTHTLQREFLEPTTNASFAFTTPYYYTGLSFGGDPDYLECAQNLDSTSSFCANLTICVAQYTTYSDILETLFAPSLPRILVYNMSLTTVPQFSSQQPSGGGCNVFAADSLALMESVYRTRGYKGRWKTGTKLFSKDPLTLVTRGTDDPTFSALVNLVVNILFSADAAVAAAQQQKEELDNQADADDGPSSTNNTTAIIVQQLLTTKGLEDFVHNNENNNNNNEEFKSLVINVVSQLGTMDTIYSRDNKSRQGLNRLHNNLKKTHHDDTNTTTGLLYSYPFGTLERSPPPDGGQFVEAGGVLETILDRGYLLCGIVSPRDGGGDDEPEISMAEFNFHAEFCRALAKALFPGAKTVADYLEVVEILDPSESFQSLARGDIDVLAGERVNLLHSWSESTTGLGFRFAPPHYYKGDDAFALATRQDDPQWSSLTYWVVMAIIYAEENGISHGEAYSAMPEVPLFGDSLKDMFRSCVQEVGNYGDIYNRTLQAVVSRSGRNTLNSGGNPQQVGFPFV